MLTVKAALPSCRVQADVAVPPANTVLVVVLVTPLRSELALYTPICVLPADAFTMAEPVVVLPVFEVLTSNPPPVPTILAPVMVLVVPFIVMPPAVILPLPTPRPLAVIAPLLMVPKPVIF